MWSAAFGGGDPANTVSGGDVAFTASMFDTAVTPPADSNGQLSTPARTGQQTTAGVSPTAQALDLVEDTALITEVGSTVLH